MRYKQFKELSLSTLGLGNMRLPTIGERGPIDEAKAEELIDYAYQHGINYFDTAQGYHNGQSKFFVGKVLKKYPRDTWHIAMKLPGHMMEYKDGKIGNVGYMKDQKPVESIPALFQEQLDACQVDYFDFYLLHNVCETSFDFYTNEELGVVKYLISERDKGRIKHLGFSTHARVATLEKFLDIYPNVFEFVQPQLNYIDWTLQEADKKYALLTERNIPVMVMEPCRGGKLADLGNEANEMLKAVLPDRTIASWAFRFVGMLPNVQVVLSGMTTMEQLKENIELFEKEEPLNNAELEVLHNAAKLVMNAVPCTACRYCCEVCPTGLNIPELIKMYNESVLSGVNIVRFTTGAMKKEELPGACVKCGGCEQVCPQGIKIPEIMAKFDELLK